MAPDATAIAAALSGLDKLNQDEYIVAFGPEGRQLVGTSEGWAATYLPSKICDELIQVNAKKFLWASFGDVLESWFFVFETRGGSIRIRMGDDAPRSLHSLVDSVAEHKSEALGAVRAQLGDGGSFVMWFGTHWACRGLHPDLFMRLSRDSIKVKEWDDCYTGRFVSDGIIGNIQWLRDGSYFIKIGWRHIWMFCSPLVREQWVRLWNGIDDHETLAHVLPNLAHVALDHHARESDTFAFFLKQTGEDTKACFILRCGNEPIYARLLDNDRLKDTETLIPKDEVLDKPTGEVQAQNIDHHRIRWATSIKAGRPHRYDARELELKEGEKIQVVSDAGRNWYLAIGRKGIRGYVHGSWLKFDDQANQDGLKATVENKSKRAYKRFNEFVQSLEVGKLERFPLMSDYMDICKNEECKVLKEARSLLGVCAHDMDGLLRGSESYSYEWLKEGRNMWHPDRFTRFCVPELVDETRAKAEEMFVIYSILMERVKADPPGQMR